MPLPISDTFKRDIQPRDTSLIPLIVISRPTSQGGDIAISTQDYTLNNVHYAPLLLNVSSISESVDLNRRKFKINSSTFTISNYKYNWKLQSGFSYGEGELRFSEILPSYTNFPVKMYWVGPSVQNIGHAFLIYSGKIKNYQYDIDKVTLVVEDDTQINLSRELPTKTLGIGEDVPDRYKNKFFPMVYGKVDRSPCVMTTVKYDELEDITVQKRTSFTVHMDFNPIVDFVRESPYPDITNVPHTSFLYIFKDGQYYRVVENYSEETTGRAKIRQDDDTILDLQWTAPQIDPDELIPATNGGYNPSISMVAKYSESVNTAVGDHVFDQGRNSLGSEKLEVDFIKVPSSVTPTLIGLSDSDPGNLGTQGNPDQNNLNLLEGQNLKNLLDLNPDTNVHIGQHYSASTNDPTEFNGMGFIFKFSNHEIDPIYVATRLQLKQEWGCIGHTAETGGQVTPELNFNCYYNQKTFPVSYYDGGPYLLSQNLLTDNLFQSGYVAGNALEHGTFDIHPFTINALDPIDGLSWDEWTIQSGSILEPFPLELDSTFSLYQIHSVFTNDTRWYWKLYGLILYHYMIVEKPTEQKYFANITGRRVVGPDYQGYTGRPTNVVNQIRDILATELNVVLGWGTGSKQWQSWNTAASYMDQFGIQEHSYSITSKIKGKKLIEQLASTAPFFTKFDSQSNFRFILIPHDGAMNTIGDVNWTNEQTIKSSDCISYKFKLTDEKSVYSKIVFKYNYDYGIKDFLNVEEMTFDSPEVKSVVGFDVASTWYNYYRFNANAPWESELIIDDHRSKYIRDPETAKRFAFWTFMWHYNSHVILDLRLSLKYMVLEVGDICNIDSLIGDIAPYMRNYTEEISLNGQAIYPSFLVTKTQKSLNYIDLQLIQLHELAYPEVLAEQYQVDQWGSPITLYPIANPNQVNMVRASDSFTIQQLHAEVPSLSVVFPTEPSESSGYTMWGGTAEVASYMPWGWGGTFNEFEKDKVYWVQLSEETTTDKFYNAGFFESSLNIPVLDV